MKRKYGIIFGAVAIALLMVSTVTALPATVESETTNNVSTVPNVDGSQTVSKIKDAKARLEALRNSELFLQIKQIVDNNFPHQYDQYVHEQLSSYLETFAPKETLGSLADLALSILILIADLIMFLCGHNAVGQALAMLGVSLAAIPISIPLGLIDSLTLDVEIAKFFVENFKLVVWDPYVGLIGFVITALLYIAIAVIVELFTIFVGPLFCAGVMYLALLDIMYDYIYDIGPSQQTTSTTFQLYG